MRYKLLGNSALRVSELCLGTMTFGNDWGWGAAGDDAARIFDAFATVGGNFIHTANVYTDGTSERLLGDLLAADCDPFVVATKFACSTRRGDPNAGGAHRKNLMKWLEASLRHLRTDRVHLLWVHIWDFLTSPEEVMRALDDLVRAGKILHLGLLTRRRGSSRTPTRLRRRAGGRPSPRSRPSTAWWSAAWSGSSSPWPEGWASRSPLAAGLLSGK